MEQIEFDSMVNDFKDSCSNLIEKDIIINFLKKELAHKMSYRQVMKKQYKELKQKYETLYRKCVCCPMCKHYDPCVTVNGTIGNACEKFGNGCNNNPIIPFAHFEMR